MSKVSLLKLRRKFDFAVLQFNYLVTLVIFLLYLSSSIAEASTLKERLMQADSYRLQGLSTKTLIEVSQFEKSELKQKQVYVVYSKSGKGSLVVFRTAAEAGQKMLMLDDKFWMFMPKSRRPIRITPMQKLLGDASAGDISSLSWSDSYDVAIQDESVSYENKEAISLTLKSNKKGSTYHQIELILNREDNFPLKADLFLKSGKMAKSAFFTKGQREGSTVVTSMTLKDSIQKNRETVITYKSSSPHDIADKLFNPSYLIKNRKEDL